MSSSRQFLTTNSFLTRLPKKSILLKQAVLVTPPVPCINVLHLHNKFTLHCLFCDNRSGSSMYFSFASRYHVKSFQQRVLAIEEVRLFFSWFQWLVFQVLAMHAAFPVLLAYSGLASEAIQLLQCLAPTRHSSQQISLASSRGNFVAECFLHELHSLAP